MSKHVASVRWIDDGGFATGRYSRVHELRFDGGTVVRGSPSPEVVPLPFSDPAGVDPEEALVAAVSACHMLWFLSLAQQAGLSISSYRDSAEGRMRRIGRGRHAITHIVLRPEIDFRGVPPGQSELDRLHHEADTRCFIANSLKAEIRVEAPLAEAGRREQAAPATG
jgi:organic hydroperoxide reductase OsmC/OhrA